METMPPMPPMPPMAMPPPSPPMPPMPMPMDMPTMHAAFYWGHQAQVLFSNWPGNDRSGFGMYVLCLVVVAHLAALAEVLAAWSRALAAGRAPNSDEWTTTTLQVCVHVLKVGLSYMVMLAVMSFNGGVFLVVVAGHASGYLIAQNWRKVLRRVTAAAAREDDGVHTNGGGAVPPSSEEPRP